MMLPSVEQMLLRWQSRTSRRASWQKADLQASRQMFLNIPISFYYYGLGSRSPAIQFAVMSTREQLFTSFSYLFVNAPRGEPFIFEIDVINLLCQNEQQAQLFALNPSQYLKELHSMNKSQQLEKRYDNCFITYNTRIVLKNIPFVESIYKKFTQISAKDIGTWIVLTGTVIQLTQKKTLEKTKVFSCQECGHEIRLSNSYHNFYHFEMPICEQEGKPDSMLNKFFHNMYKRKAKTVQRDGGVQHRQGLPRKCSSMKYSAQQGNKVCMDYQELRMQEPFRHISAGKMPQTITVLLEGYYETIFRPGDDIAVSGIIDYRYKKPIRESKMHCQLVLVANNITIQKMSNLRDNLDRDTASQDTQYTDYPLNLYNEFNLTSQERIIVKQLEFRDQILSCFCPSIFGKHIVKLGLILALLGGVSIRNQTTNIRGQSHVLLIGEPGTGKSVLLKEAASLAERSFFTNGIGTSSAGLSVSYYKDGADWAIEAGALVLADNGVCCIDQLTLLSKKDEHSLLEAMEQQTISSAKASIVGKLNARTTVICACNPITPGQKYNTELDLEGNTGLSIPLLTRFDLIMILKDEQDRNEDCRKCEHVLSKFQTGFGEQCEQRSTVSLKLLMKKCRAFQPELQQGNILSKYYTCQRKNVDKVTTARAFESLCRLTQAHAKLMMRDTTCQLDCISAIMITQNKHASTIEEYYAFLDQFNNKYQTELR